MVKNVNESRKDPERSAAAKGRKPPPNPWAKLRAAEALADSLQAQLGAAQDYVERANQRANLAEHARERAKLREVYMRDIQAAYYALVVALERRTLFRRNTRDIEAARVHLRDSFNALSLFDKK